MYNLSKTASILVFQHHNGMSSILTQMCIWC